MAAAPTDTTTAISGNVAPRRRGKSKAPNFKYDGPVSVIRLELDVSDARVRRRLERQWAAVFRLRRALQRNAAARCRAYWVAHHERGADPKGLRARLGLSRKGIEAAAKSHIEASGWMRDHLTKAIGLHVADEVWETVDRHLFPDSSGRRRGPPRIGSWWDFTRIPGRARSHTKVTPAWETWRLVGTLDGHLATYRHPELPAVSTAVQAAGQPGHLGAGPAGPTADPGAAPLGVVGRSRCSIGGGIHRPAGWRCGVAGAPTAGSGSVGAPEPFPGRPSRLDLVRVRDRKAPGGWRYYAHLLTHQPGYQSADTRARRAQIPMGRRAGVDANVSNLALASFPGRHPEQLHVEQVTCTEDHHRTRADLAAQARAASQAKHARAREVAARIVATHGNVITVEDCTISTWARLWGKRIALFSPGMLVGALARECAAADGAVQRAGTHSTALSQHCLCGARVPKPLAQRTHHCPACGLRADRDVTSAVLAACVDMTDPDDPATARVDYTLAHALRAWLASQQEWEGSVNRYEPPASPDAGSARAGSRHLVASAEQAALGPPPNRPDMPGRRGNSRREQHPKLFGVA